MWILKTTRRGDGFDHVETEEFKSLEDIMEVPLYNKLKWKHDNDVYTCTIQIAGDGKKREFIDYELERSIL